MSWWHLRCGTRAYEPVHKLHGAGQAVEARICVHPPLHPTQNKQHRCTQGWIRCSTSLKSASNSISRTMLVRVTSLSHLWSKMLTHRALNILNHLRKFTRWKFWQALAPGKYPDTRTWFVCIRMLKRSRKRCRWNFPEPMPSSSCNLHDCIHLTPKATGSAATKPRAWRLLTSCKHCYEVLHWLSCDAWLVGCTVVFTGPVHEAGVEMDMCVSWPGIDHKNF